MNICIWDKSVADYPRLENEHSDDRRIMRAVADCAGGVLYFPKGIYSIADMLVVDNCCSFLLHKSAIPQERTVPDPSSVHMKQVICRRERK